MFQPNPEDHLHLRLHRARSVVLTTSELVEVRAAQRTFEGAYTRTALGQFSFALIVLKVFSSEFYPIGGLFAFYGAAVLLVAMYRRYEGQRQFFNSLSSPTSSPQLQQHFAATTTATELARTITAASLRRENSRANAQVPADPAVAAKFRTSGNSVVMLTALSIGAYVTLLVLTWRLSL